MKAEENHNAKQRFSDIIASSRKRFSLCCVVLGGGSGLILNLTEKSSKKTYFSGFITGSGIRLPEKMPKGTNQMKTTNSYSVKISQG